MGGEGGVAGGGVDGDSVVGVSVVGDSVIGVVGGGVSSTTPFIMPFRVSITVGLGLRLARCCAKVETTTNRSSSSVSFMF